MYMKKYIYVICTYVHVHVRFYVLYKMYIHVHIYFQTKKNIYVHTFFKYMYIVHVYEYYIIIIIYFYIHTLKCMVECTQERIMRIADMGRATLNHPPKKGFKKK